MTVNRTTLLDLPLPVTGTESGTWGDTTNNGLTQYLDIAIAGTLVLSTDADVTLTSTEGDSSATNIGATTAQYAILRWTATGSTTRNITALAQSKTYVVINATGGTQSIVLRGAGPTTGVTIISGEKALCVWNGSDFVKVSSSAAAGGSNTQVQYNSSGVLAGSSNMTFDGTSLTLGGNPTLSAGTANGVLYLNGSKVATSGSALVFDGTNLGIGTSSPLVKFDVKVTTDTHVGIAATGIDEAFILAYDDAGVRTPNLNYAAASHKFLIASTEAMRLTSTGLGIGTSSPATKLQVVGTATFGDGTNGQIRLTSNSSLNYLDSLNNAASAWQNLTQRATVFDWFTAVSGTPSTGMSLDSSGNLGLGVTPSAWGGAGKALQMTSGSSVAANGAIGINSNAYYDGSVNKYITTNPATQYVQGSGVHYWYTAPSGTAGNTISFTQAMTLDASGNLLVGTTNAAENAGSGMKVLNTGGTVALVSTASDASQQGFEMYSTTAAAYRLYINYAGTINATSTTISAISDQRLKENIQDLDVGLDKIMALKPRKFDWKTGKGKDIKGDRGWIAQEFEQVFPDLIDEWRDPAPEGEEPYKSVRADLIPILVKAIQEQQALITSLTARVALLEGN